MSSFVHTIANAGLLEALFLVSTRKYRALPKGVQCGLPALNPTGITLKFSDVQQLRYDKILS